MGQPPLRQSSTDGVARPAQRSGSVEKAGFLRSATSSAPAASATSGFGPPAIAQPTGGGALRGIGEKFRANPASGTASFEIPLQLPKGRGEIGPDIALQYSSAGGNGPFGLGWSLALPSISRKTDKGVPKYDATDIYVLAGAEDLVPFRAPPLTHQLGGIKWQICRYRPRIEAAFQRIELWTSTDRVESHWRITDRQNNTSVFGTTAESRVSHPDDPSRVFSWLLSEVRDDRGNVVLYRYKVEDAAGVDRASTQERPRFEVETGKFLAPTQRYLKKILYGNTRSPEDLEAGSRFEPIASQDAVARNWCFHVVFDYGEHGPIAKATSGAFTTAIEYEGAISHWETRPDPFSTCRPGFEVRTYRRCRRVLVFHEFTELGDDPVCVSQQILTYDESPHLSRLRAFEINGLVSESAGRFRGDSSQAVPPLRLTYSDAGPTETQVYAHADLGIDPVPAVTGIPYSWVDLDGEGVVGALWPSERGWRYRRNLGNGVLAAPILVESLPALSVLAEGQQQLLDINADGRLDLVQTTPPAAGFHTRSAEGSWLPRQLFSSVPNIDWNEPDLRFVDLTGDGLADILITRDDSLLWLQSLGSKGYDQARRRLLEVDELNGPRGLFANAQESLLLADMNGDGLVDLVRIRNGSVCYWPSLGHCNFGPKVTLAVDTLFDAPGEFDPKRMRLADVDGSGTTDLIYLRHDRAMLFANQSGNSLLLPPREVSIPRFDNSAHVEAIDVLGRGTACLVWSSTGLADQRRPLHIIDLMGGIKPHLLTCIDNGFGGTTRIEYTSSASQYLADRAAGKRWFTRLPFPVQVVSKVVKADAVAGTELTTTYSYRHGFFDGGEREFRGFGFVEQCDAEVFPGAANNDQLVEHRPPAVTRTWFHTGAWVEGRRLEELYATEYFAGDPDAQRLPDTQWPSDVLASDLRESVRALKGQPLRVETYALDAHGGEELDARPYVVSEYAYSTSVLQVGDDIGPAVVQVRADETLQYYYERVTTDPRVTHELVLRYDEFGQPIRRATVAYPRRAERNIPSQRRCLATVSDYLIVNEVGFENRYRLGTRAAEVRFELVGLTPPAARSIFRPASLQETFQGLDEVAWAPFASPPAGVIGKQLVAASCSTYWSDDLDDAALPVGRIGRRAILRERFDLVMDDSTIQSTLDVDDSVRTLLLANRDKLGYSPAPDFDAAATADFPLPSGSALWWRPSGRLQPDPALFYVPSVHIDPFGSPTLIGHDPYGLVLVRTEDALRNVTVADIDYRVLSARRITDPNENVVAIAYEPNGKLQAIAMLGKGEGDTIAEPTLEYSYVLRGLFTGASAPMHVQTLEREQHVNARMHKSDVRRTRIEYTDGFGREALTMLEAEPGPVPLLTREGHLRIGSDGHTVLTELTKQRWVGSGRVVYDNKGNAVRRYEPFFWPDSSFPAEPALRQWGVSPAFHHDPLGRLIRIDNPDGSCACIVFSPWHVERWDENDTVLNAPIDSPSAPDQPWVKRMEEGNEAQQDAARKASRHAATPQTEHLDPLGRMCVRSTPESDPERASSEQRAAPFIYTTLHERDIDGRELSVTDPIGRVIARTTFDLLGRPAVAWLADSGKRWNLPNAVDQPAYEWSERGLRWRTEYDVLRRPTHRCIRWPAADDPRDPVRALRFDGTVPPVAHSHRGRETLAERLYYGEDMPRQEARDANLLGHLAGQFDDAGYLHFVAYDFKNNPIEQRRQLSKEFRAYTDWSLIAATKDRYEARTKVNRLLDPREFSTFTIFDARNRIVEHRSPDERVTLPSYNEAGLLESLVVREPRGIGSRRVIDNIDYNARGERVRIVYGERRNGAHQISSRYTYDPLTFRLQELYSWRDGLGTYPYQQLNYTYDAVGNITSIANTGAKRTFAWSGGGGIVDGDQAFTYDALYQLIQATGREHPYEAPAHGDPLRDQVEHPSDLTALRRYTQQFEYDRNGNLVRTRHTAGSSGWTLPQTYDAQSNRLRTVGGAATPFEYEHDAHGNVVTMPHLALLDWDADDRLKRSARNEQQWVWFAYDASGQRVRKVFEANGTRDETVYIGGFEQHTRTTGRRTRERSTLHVVDGERRVAMIESVLSDDFGELQKGTGLRYQLADHLGSTTVECDETGDAIAYEEFRPFGTTAVSVTNALPGAIKRRYRFTGKERDEETGLHYFGARYYAPWLSRWISSDPLLKHQRHPPVADFRSQAYVYVNNRPTIANDPDGQVANVVVGAAIGAALGAAVDLGMQFATGAANSKDGINWRSVAASATGGAVSGALAGATFGASLVAQGAASSAVLVVAKGAASGAVDAVAGATTRAVAGEGANAIARGAAQDFAIGVATFGLLKGSSKVVRSLAESPLGHKVDGAIKEAWSVVSNEHGSIRLNEGPSLSSRGARRQAMREAGIPTSQQPTSQLSTKAGKQLVYEMPVEGGGIRKMVVTDQTTDRVIGHGPHWEAGPAKIPERIDFLGRIRVVNMKAKVDYEP